MNNFNFPISECPKCGGKMITIRQKISGTGEYYVDLETGNTESSELHNNLTYRNIGKYAICTDCGKKLFKVDDRLNVVE